jgi:hypothetical protein
MDGRQGTMSNSDPQCQRVQRGLLKSILLVFSVTLATIVNVRMTFNLTNNFGLIYSHAGRECFGFRNGFAYYSEGNATSTNVPTTSMDRFWLSS